MTELSIFNFKSYKAYLKAWIRSRPSRGRGEKRRIAEKSGCHSAYVSQVLEHAAHFTMEQAAALNRYLGHGSIESRFFLLLVQFERAGTPELREQTEKQIDDIIAHRITIQNRIENKVQLSLEDQAIYYSSWHYAAIHMVVHLASCQTKEAISKYLEIPPRKTAEVIEFLVSKGLIAEKQGRYSFGSTDLHLPHTSPLISKMHTSWRMRAIDSLDEERPHDLHFSSIATVRESDLKQARQILMKAIEDLNALVKSSTNEDTLFCFNVDLFRP
jgi:uncharacterized protein (TIGR02147 family)